jgi:hypothetical protein
VTLAILQPSAAIHPGKWFLGGEPSRTEASDALDLAAFLDRECRMSALQLDSDVRIGRVLSFSYPDDNRFGVKTRLRRRQVFIRRIRDCEFEPVEEWARLKRPTIRRGRILVRSYDLELHCWRQFYLGSARSLKPLDMQLRRLAYYNPEFERAPLHWFGSIYTDSRADQQRIREVIQYANSLAAQSQFTITVGLFPIEARHADDSRISA